MAFLDFLNALYLIGAVGRAIVSSSDSNVQDATESKDTAVSGNYIFAHHIGDKGKLYRIPIYPRNIQDTLTPNYRESQTLARTAPIQSWVNSGPRTLSFSIDVHRDYDYYKGRNGDKGEKMADFSELLDEYQAINLPNTSEATIIKPPRVTVKIGSNSKGGHRITGVPTITVLEKEPIIDGVYQSATITITVKELIPYSEKDVSSLGNARGIKLYQNSNGYYLGK